MLTLGQRVLGVGSVLFLVLLFAYVNLVFGIVALVVSAPMAIAILRL